MDEFIHYHALSCMWYPANYLNQFHDGCGSMDLVLFDLRLPLRNYVYIGTGPGIFYAPLLYLFPSYYSARLLGLTSIIAIAWILKKVFQLNGWIVFWSLCCLFPLVLQVMLDTGPVAFQLGFAFLGPYILSRYPKNVWIILLISLGVFYAFWTKPFFFVISPFIMVWGLYLLFTIGKTKQLRFEIFSSYCITTFISLLLLLLLLISNDIHNTPYWKILVIMNERIPLSVLLQKSVLINFLKDFSLFAGRFFLFTETNLYSTIATSLFWLTFLLIIIQSLRQKSEKRLWAIFFFFSGIATYFLIAQNIRSDNVHHIIFVFPALITAFLILTADLFHHENSFIRKYSSVFTVIFISTQLVALVQLTTVKLRPENSWDLVTINHALNDSELAKKSLYIAVNWGDYFYQSLYGDKNQAVLYIDPFSIDLIKKIKQISLTTGRSPIFIGRTDQNLMWIDVVKQEFPSLSQDKTIAQNLKTWALWKVE